MRTGPGLVRTLPGTNCALFLVLSAAPFGSQQNQIFGLTLEIQGFLPPVTKIKLTQPQKAWHI